MERYYNFAGEAILRAKNIGIPALLEVNSPMIEYPGSLKSKVDFFLGGAFGDAATGKLQKKCLNDSFANERKLTLEFMRKSRQIEWGADTNLFNPDPLPDRSSLRKQLGLIRMKLIIHFGKIEEMAWLTKLLEAYTMLQLFQKVIPTL